MRPRLVATLVLPTLLVAFGLHVLEDVRGTFLLYVIGACGLVPWALLGVRPLSGRQGLPFRREGERLWSPAGLPLAFVLFGPVFLGVYAWIRASITAPEPYMETLHAYGWNDASTTLYLVLFAGLVPLMEEWWWRGQALPRCVAAFGPRGGVVAAALGFAAYHAVVLLVLYEPALAMLRFSGIFVAGIAWTAFAYRRGSWAWVYVAHLAADLVLVTAFLLWVLPTA